MLIHLKTADFGSTVLQSDKPVLVDFWAPWCGPCRMIGPIVEALAEEYDGRATVCKVNVDEEGDLAKRFRIMSIPAVYIFRDGEPVQKFVGARSRADYAAALEENM